MEQKIYTLVNDSNRLDYIDILEGMINGTLPNESEIHFLYEGKNFTCSKNALTINGNNVANVRQALTSLQSHKKSTLFRNTDMNQNPKYTSCHMPFFTFLKKDVSAACKKCKESKNWILTKINRWIYLHLIYLNKGHTLLSLVSQKQE